MAGRKRRNIGRLPKRYEAIVQSAAKNRRGRPRKRNAPKPLPPEADTSPATTEFVLPDPLPPEANTSQATTESVPPDPLPPEADTSQATTESVPPDPLSSLNLVSVVTESPLNLPSDLWSIHYSDSDMKICKLQDCGGSMKVIHSLTVLSDGSWMICSYGTEIDPSSGVLMGIPSALTRESLQDLIILLEEVNICPGHPDDELVDFVKSNGGKVLAGSQEPLATIDEFAPVSLRKEKFDVTVRSLSCKILVKSGKCASCTHIRSSLRAKFRRWKAKKKTTPTRHTSTSSHTNIRYINESLTRQRFRNIKKRLLCAERTVSRLKATIAQRVQSEGISVSEGMHMDMQKLMEAMGNEIEGLEKNTFQRLFWEEQLAASKVLDHRQMKWHPMMIRWSLFMRSKSPCAYDALRKVLRLPSNRTLRDYTHVYNPQLGFQREVDEQLHGEMNVDSLQNHQKFIGIIFDEMKIKEGIVYEKHANEVLGFVNLGEVTNQLLDFERVCNNQSEQMPPIAKHINCFMVRGIFVRINFPYAQFATDSVSADILFPTAWEAVKRLESLGLKVLFITCDGVSANRKFFKMHGKDTYKTPNIYSEDQRSIYFFVDTPHLLKTARNCFSQSFGHSNKRAMWRNGKYISWEHVKRVYNKRTSTGLALVPKLKYDHLQLTSYSRMRVYLAAQVLSTTVANAMSYLGQEDTSETEKFIRYMDKFFDCLNVRSLSEGTNKLKPNLFPYRKASDDRLKWLEEEFLKYLTSWEDDVQRRGSFTAGQKAKMLLSKETMSGLKITVKSFVEIARYLLKQEGVEYILSERFNQDPLEGFFGQQRAHGGRCDNPSVQQFIKNTVSLRVQKSAALAPLRGNSRKHHTEITVDNTPLPKRHRK